MMQGPADGWGYCFATLWLRWPCYSNLARDLALGLVRVQVERPAPMRPWQASFRFEAGSTQLRWLLERLESGRWRRRFVS